MPVYETPQDRENELRVAKIVAEKSSTLLIKLDLMLYPVDFGFYLPGSDIPGSQGMLKFLAEVKCRTCKPTTFSHYMIGLGKWENIRNYPYKCGLFVEFADGEIYACGRNAPYEVRMGKREEMRREFDMEPCAFIPMEAFRRWA